MSGANYPGSGHPGSGYGSGNQPSGWGGQSGSPVGGYPGQNNPVPGGYPNMPGQPPAGQGGWGAPNQGGYPGPGGFGPGGQPLTGNNSGGKSGPPIWAIVLIVLLVAAIIGVALWGFVFRGSDTQAAPAPEGSVSASTQPNQEGGTSEGDKNTEKAQEPDNGQGGQETGGNQQGKAGTGAQPGQNKDNGGGTTGMGGGQEPSSGKLDLPAQIGEWSFDKNLSAYSKGDFAKIVFVLPPIGGIKLIETSIKFSEPTVELEGGKCGIVEAEDGTKAEQCYITTRKGTELILTSAGVGVNEIAELAKALIEQA